MRGDEPAVLGILDQLGLLALRDPGAAADAGMPRPERTVVPPGA